MYPRDDYEVSREETGRTGRSGMETEGVIGSRITGGGFGGCNRKYRKRMNAVDHFHRQTGKLTKKRQDMKLNSM